MNMDETGPQMVCKRFDSEAEKKERVLKGAQWIKLIKMDKKKKEHLTDISTHRTEQIKSIMQNIYQIYHLT